MAFFWIQEQTNIFRTQMMFNPIGLPQIFYGAPRRCGAPRVEEAQCQRSVHPEQLESYAQKSNFMSGASTEN
jgi:hypothetical protein